ncbi:YetF domain-containing protein [Bradyrhizobium sp. DASA03005]|uniref:YetF domain-containing protein n=1 Tax=Bradyrhizobium sp. SPXBL-02 TaxID=3395912 RepID=UPI003F70170C
MANPQPELLLHRGKFLQDAMRRQRVAEADVRAAIRHQGIGRVEDVDAVVPEADGTFSVTRTLGPSASALAVYHGWAAPILPIARTTNRNLCRIARFRL